MRLPQTIVQADGLQKQSERFFVPALDPVQLRQIIVGTRVARLPLDPRALFLDMEAGLVAKREMDDFLTPETHFPYPIRTIRTSMTLVLVGPVITRSPSDSK